MSWKNNSKYRCPHCRSVRLVKDGFVRGKQRYRCLRCGKRTIRPKGGNGKG